MKTLLLHSTRHKIFQKVKLIDILSHLPHLELGRVRLGEAAPRILAFAAPRHDFWGLSLAFNIQMESAFRLSVYAHKPTREEAMAAGKRARFWSRLLERFLAKVSVRVQLRRIEGEMLLNIPHASGKWF